MRLLNAQGEMIGVVSRAEALHLAEQEGKDVILIAPQAVPPVAKLIEISKYKYQQQQRKQEVRKASKPAEIKEIRLSPFIAEGDLEARARKVRKYLEDGDKVRFQLRFRGREITKKEFGEGVLNKIFAQVEDIAKIEVPAKMQGKMMTMQLMPDKKAKS